MTVEQAISGGLDRLHIRAPQGTAARLAAFIALLNRWNRAYNLTAIRDPKDMVTRHILDSLAILPWLQGPRVLDVGSGAGLPGLPLAIVRPELNFCLLDSNGKRTRFMMQAVVELNLKNVDVVRSRVEDYRPEMIFNSVVSRAFGSLADLLARAEHLCAPRGRVLAMKGSRPDDELKDLPAGYAVVGVHGLQVPGLDAERHLIHCSALGIES